MKGLFNMPPAAEQKKVKNAHSKAKVVPNGMVGEYPMNRVPTMKGPGTPKKRK